MTKKAIAKMMIEDEQGLLKQDDETAEEYETAREFVKEHIVFMSV